MVNGEYLFAISNYYKYMKQLRKRVVIKQLLFTTRIPLSGCGIIANFNKTTNNKIQSLTQNLKSHENTNFRFNFRNQVLME